MRLEVDKQPVAGSCSPILEHYGHYLPIRSWEVGRPSGPVTPVQVRVLRHHRSEHAWYHFAEF